MKEGEIFEYFASQFTFFEQECRLWGSSIGLPKAKNENTVSEKKK